jgi:hypothetical protein
MDYADREVLASDVDHTNRAIDAWLAVHGLDFFVGDVRGRLGRLGECDCRNRREDHR